MALFAVGAVYDLWGRAAARRVLPVLIAVGVIFYGITRLIPGSFLVFVLYEAAAMLFALAVYVLLSIRGSLRGARFMALGVFVSIVAAAVQASGAVAFTWIWEFDHNGVGHRIQVMAVSTLFIVNPNY